ncbi:MAG: hypothetical protein ACTSP4_16150 [Candidatus Hodarchaeales archaeon]
MPVPDLQQVRVRYHYIMLKIDQVSQINTVSFKCPDRRNKSLICWLIDNISNNIIQSRDHSFPMQIITEYRDIIRKTKKEEKKTKRREE